jgi:hypothetical protein
MIDNSGANEIAIFEAWHLNTSSIEKDLALFVRLRNNAFNSLFRLFSNKRSNIWVVNTSTNSELLGSLNNFGDPLL